MAARNRLLWLAPVLGLTGCLPDQGKLPLVRSDPFNSQPHYQDKSPKLPKGSREQAIRVDKVGQDLVRANEQSGLHPMFMTIGQPQSEVFHQGTAQVFITEALTRKCKTEGELAAVLALEMGKMVAEREIHAGPGVHHPDREPPTETPIGHDSGGTFGAADGTHLAELAKFEKENPRTRAPFTPPDPAVLARGYLEKAGFSAKDLETVAPYLKEARGSMTLERQILNRDLTRPWGE
jgi:hypothetical protein